MKHRFDQKFEQQLIRAMSGHAPWKAVTEQPYIPIGPSEKQIYWLTKHKKPIPATKAEATEILSRLFAK